MKIMYVDTSVYGHHLIYLNNLLRMTLTESFSVLPIQEGNVVGRCYRIPEPAIRTFSGYRKWIKELKKIALEEHPDIIHFWMEILLCVILDGGFRGSALVKW